MKISEVKAGTANATIEGEIINVEEPRDVTSRFGKRLRVANATLKDDSGEIVLSLWGDDINRIKVGDNVKIENGWVSEFKGNMQISPGKYGKLTVLGKED
jgi:replication factor A1